MPEQWSTEEVQTIVADYFAMLANELRGEDYNKTAHRRALQPLLQNRSDGSIERKHQNISAILAELHVPWISGYKPLHNYQQLLAEIVVARLSATESLRDTALRIVEAPPPTRSVTNIAFEQPPFGARKSLYVREPLPLADWLRKARSIDYFAREARNQALGAAGEELVVQLERKRLTKSGRDSLADRVERISSTRGDGAGFDVLSFESDGRERFIEVKTTSFAKQTPFNVTKSEVDFSSDFAESYHLYRLFTFRDRPRLYELAGALEQTCVLAATSFLATVV